MIPLYGAWTDAITARASLKMTVYVANLYKLVN